MKRLAIAITALAVLALLTWAVIRGWASRELILERNGVPLANLHGRMMLSVPGAPIVPTGTDSQGRLDLRGVPWATEQINVELRDGAGNVRVPNTFFQLPKRGIRKIDSQGNRSVSTTTTIYADFGFFQLSNQEVVTWERETK